jgi:hypothetical protein
MKKYSFLIMFSLICEAAFCSGVGEWVVETGKNASLGIAIGEYYIEQMEQIDSGAKFLHLVDSYISKGYDVRRASEQALKDYDPYLYMEIYQNIKTSNKSQLDTVFDVSFIISTAGLEIYDYYRPSANSTNNTNATVNDFADVSFAYATSDLNMRSGPSSDAVIVTVISRNERVEIIQNTNENTQRWIKVKYNQFVGFVNVGYLRK